MGLALVLLALAGAYATAPANPSKTSSPHRRGLRAVVRVLAPCAVLGAGHAAAEPRHRVGVDGVALAGPNFMLGGGARYEIGPARQGIDGVARIDLLHGGPIEGGKRSVVAATVGMRVFPLRALFLETGVGVGGLYKHAYDDVHSQVMVSYWEAQLAVRVALGVKIGVFDIGVALHLPSWGPGIQLGVDVASW